jgi:hypothetical protein
MQWQLSVAEAAEVMKLSTGAVKRYTSGGLRRLRAQLDPARDTSYPATNAPSPSRSRSTSLSST